MTKTRSLTSDKTLTQLDKQKDMKRVNISAVVIGLLAVFSAILVTACSGTTSADEIQISGPYTPNIDLANFTRSAEIDNRYFPLIPGTTRIYEGTEDEDTIRIEEYVTHDTREIMGVTAVVVRVKEWVNGELAEDTFDWFAQDNDGNVWYFGEDSTEYEKGKAVSTEGSWEAGVAGAQPGILMKAEPRLGDAYRQEYLPDEAEDMGEVVKINESTSVAYGPFDALVVIKEWTPLEPDVIEYDYYAQGIGAILEEVVKGGAERIELVKITTE